MTEETEAGQGAKEETEAGRGGEKGKVRGWVVGREGRRAGRREDGELTRGVRGRKGEW